MSDALGSRRADWVVGFAYIAISIILVMISSSCAIVKQDLSTMDGDTFSQTGWAFMSKQKVTQASTAKFSDSTSIGLNTDGDQTSESAIQLISALLQLLQTLGSGIGGGSASPADVPSASPSPYPFPSRVP